MDETRTSSPPICVSRMFSDQMSLMSFLMHIEWSDLAEDVRAHLSLYLFQTDHLRPF
jgi:hypothetical protein